MPKLFAERELFEPEVAEGMLACPRCTGPMRVIRAWWEVVARGGALHTLVWGVPGVTPPHRLTSPRPSSSWPMLGR
jgi:hypothetical protein